MRSTAGLLVLGLGALGWWSPSSGAAIAPVTSAPVAQVVDSAFRHDRHTGFACLDCHAMQPRHGVRLVRTAADCRSCHHVRERGDRECVACHTPAEMRNVVYPVSRAFTLSVRSETLVREIPFAHAAHAERECVECHTGGASLDVPDLDCRSCHEEHHAWTNPGCMTCHREPAEGAHTLEVHRTCTGSGCHMPAPVEPPRTRMGCLLCHQDRVDHEPGGECVECHFTSRRPASFDMRGRTSR